MTGERVKLDEVMVSFAQEEISSDFVIAWSAYHASVSDLPVRPKCSRALLPLFQETANSLVMVKHSLSVIGQASKHVCPSKISAVTGDQPVFALTR